MTTNLARLGTVATQDPQRLGQLLADSGYFSDARGAAQAAVKVMAGAELGFPPIQSMMGVYIVKGKVTLSANLMAAAIKRNPHYTFRVREHTQERCVIDFIERGETIGTSDFSIEDAQAAGLTGNDTWRKFPKNMLYARALSNGAKWYCPDVFGGPIYTPDELGATVDGETGELVGGGPDLSPVPPGSDVTSVLPWEPPVGEYDDANPGGPPTLEEPDEPVDTTDTMTAERIMQEIRRRGGMAVADFRAFMAEHAVSDVPSDLASAEKRQAFLGSLGREKRTEIGLALAGMGVDRSAAA